MNTQLFALFLLNKNILDKDQLRAALDKVDSIRVKLGTIAVERGKMTAEQAEMINEKQKTQDKRFGEIAANEGFLSEEEIDELLKLQEHSSVKLTQVLLDNYLTLAELEKYIQVFNSEYSLFNSELYKENIDVLIEYNISNLDEYIKEYFSLMIRSTVRFFGTPRLFGTMNANTVKFKYIVGQLIKGEKRFNTFFAMDSEDFALYIAEKFSGFKIDNEALIEDSLKESLNTFNGLFVVNMSSKDIKLDLEAPIITKEPEIEEMNFDNYICLPLEIKNGILYLMVEDK